MDSIPDSRQTSGSDIGSPQNFICGQFRGKTIRAELKELQQAELGRKYAKVDRRPLDPPPVVLLRIFQVKTNAGMDMEREVPCEEIRNVGIICTVDLFPVPESSNDGTTLPGFIGQDYHCYNNMCLPTYYPLHPFRTSDVNGRDNIISPFQIPRRQPVLSTISASDPPRDVIHRYGNHMVTESSKMTPALVGEKFVEPSLVDYKGKRALVFVFGDLAVQREGTFILRYRVFDIFSKTYGSEHPPLLAEVYGGEFKVYSTREFPGLEPSTDLTRSLSKYGIRVTLRDAERKSKKRNDSNVLRLQGVNLT